MSEKAKFQLEVEDPIWIMNWYAEDDEAGRIRYQGKPPKEEMFEHDRALPILIVKAGLFVSSIDGPFLEYENPEPNRAFEISVNLSDVFLTACADSEAISYDDLPLLWKLFHQHDGGDVVWAMTKRRMMPVGKWIERLTKYGWDLEELKTTYNIRPNYAEWWGWANEQWGRMKFSDWQKTLDDRPTLRDTKSHLQYEFYKKEHPEAPKEELDRLRKEWEQLNGYGDN